MTWPVPYWFVDAGALMMLVLLAAIDEGLASAFIGHPDQKRIFDELLGLPDGRRPDRARADRQARGGPAAGVAPQGAAAGAGRPGALAAMVTAG